MAEIVNYFEINKALLRSFGLDDPTKSVIEFRLTVGKHIPELTVTYFMTKEPDLGEITKTYKLVPK